MTEPQHLSDSEYLFTSESVTEGHPDKMADQISDGVLDAVMRDDPQGRVACETLVNTGLVVVSGEISTTTYVDIQDIARETIRKIGYTDADLGFSCDSCAVINAIDKQSSDIAQGVDEALEARTDPADDDERKHNTPKSFLVNPTVRFVIGGPVGDAGLTGRKIIVDTYGGMARHGGGAFSGKDPSKVDHSAAYAARYVAKNIVAAGLADRAEVQVAYAIGVAHPVSVMVETFGTEKDGITRSQIAKLIDEHFDLRPGSFREELKLHRPIYQKTAAYGHFGRDDHDFTWEKVDRAPALRAAAGL